MRPIKFRAKRVDNNQFIYGDLIQRRCDGIPVFYIYDNSWDETEITDCDAYTDDSFDGAVSLKSCFVKVLEESVSQFTGIKDYYGNEIYEDDIVKIFDDDIKGVIEYLNDEMTFYIRSLCGYEYPDWDKRVERQQLIVIGNIYENPDLLNTI